ncbi:hemerythrin domain-containing protein [Allobranchiibius huperziae]|uniref:Hemerythrin-like domain-containing protein n=1 Tax=Allobranchiibius huperziae TaxID=1874116 RepID=A0A853DEV1_9MICO|nr:hemerythrin domain-containing protein [Allobranchiibius huperziae]NYJ73210.1 hemerythrin-like domain-containing protein [Allobranchiibius huperziae]
MNTDRHSHTTRCWWNAEQARWVCRPVTDTAESVVDTVDTMADDEAPLVDVRDMIVVHTAMLREFRLLPAAVARVEPGALKRAVVVDRHLGFLCDMLHHHHAGEDALLWPMMRERVPEQATRLIDEVESQHVGLDAALDDVAVARAGWRSHVDAVHRDELVARLRTLYDLLKAHLELEERSVLPLAAAVLTEAEWAAIGEAGAAGLPKSTLPLVFGMFAYEGDPAVLQDMLKAAPALPRMVIPRIAPRFYARRALQVHGTRHP